MTLTFQLHPDSVKVKQHTTCQRSFSSKVIVQTHRHSTLDRQGPTG